MSVAADVDAARAALKRFDFDLLVVDVMLPDASGLDLTGELRDSGDVPILLLTARKEVEDRIKGLEAGADDYLTKPFEPRELLLRVQRILDRAAPTRATAPAEIRFGPFCFDRVHETLTRDGTPVHLTSGERQLLATLVAAPGRVFNRPWLADEAEIVGDDRAVDTQIARLRRKIEDDPRQPHFLVTVRGRGYTLRGVR